MNRSPKFLVIITYRAMSDKPHYARYAGTTKILTATKYEEFATVFTDHREADEAVEHFKRKHANNRWVEVRIERIDLCDSLLDDIDNMYDL